MESWNIVATEIGNPCCLPLAFKVPKLDGSWLKKNRCRALP